MVKHFGLHGPQTAALRGFLAVRLDLVHHTLPCPLGNGGNGRRQASASDLKIQDRLPHRFVLGVYDGKGFGLILRVETGLLAGGRAGRRCRESPASRRVAFKGFAHVAGTSRAIAATGLSGHSPLDPVVGCL